MRKNLFLLCLFLTFIPGLVKAEDVEYTLYDSNIVVNENRTLDVVENYRLYFIENTRTTTRSLELNPNIIRPNKKRLYTSTLVSDITSSNKIDVTKKKNQEVVKFDVKGLQDSVTQYDLKYKYNLGKDELKGKDEFYYDIVKNINAPISNFTFTIEFPTEIQESNVHFAINGDYNLAKDSITYTVDGNKITGTMSVLVFNNQTVSVYVELPEGYFKGATDNFNYLNYLYVIFPFIFFIITLIFYNKYGKGISLKIKRNENIYKNFDSAEIGYLFKGRMEEMDLTSLVLYLATKGYLKIVEHDDGYKLGKDNSYHFVKLKDYDGNNAAQEILFDELFRGRDKTELKDIEYHFSSTFKEALHMLGNEDNHKKLFFGGIATIKMFLLLLLIVSLVITNYRSIFLFTNSSLFVLPVILFMIFGIYVVFLSNLTSFVKGIVGIVVFVISLYIGLSPIIYQKNFLIIFLLELLLSGLIAYFYTKISDRTKYGTETLSETYGLKYYLETISKDELTNKINMNPNYFFDMVPYACTLDSLEVWIKKANGIVTTPPDWYVPSSEFDLKNFEKFVNNVLYTTSLVMMKQVYSESQLVTYENTDVKTKLND